MNRCSKIGMMSHLSCFYDTFSFYFVSFSLMKSLTMIYSMTNPTMIVLGPGYLARALFTFSENSVGPVSGIFSFSRVNGIFSFG